MSVTYPGESQDYRAARQRLLDKEAELRRSMEEVAALRRELPPGGPLPEDYALTEGEDARRVRFSELFGEQDTLVIYSMMFPRDSGDERRGPEGGKTAELALEEGPCPSCTALLDQLDGAVEHVNQHLSFVVIAKAPPERSATFARERGWRRLRILSSAGTSFNRDYHAENEKGEQRPMLNVFSRDNKSGEIRHFWGSELFYEDEEEGQDPRHVGTLEPSWNMFDLTPAGRGRDWDEQLCYSC